MEDESWRMTFGGFLARLFLSKRPVPSDGDPCFWDRKLENFPLRWGFALLGTLTYCIGFFLWGNFRVGDFGPLIIYELFSLLGLPIFGASILLSLIIAAQNRGGGPLRLFIQGVALPALVVGTVGISGTVFFTFTPGISQ